MKTLEEIKKELVVLIDEIHGCGYDQNVNCKWLGHNQRLLELIQSTISQTKQELIEKIRKAHPEWDADDLY